MIKRDPADEQKLRELLAQLTRMLAKGPGTRTKEVEDFVKKHSDFSDFKSLATTLIALAERTPYDVKCPACSAKLGKKCVDLEDG